MHTVLWQHHIKTRCAPGVFYSHGKGQVACDDPLWMDAVSSCDDVRGTMTRISYLQKSSNEFNFNSKFKFSRHFLKRSKRFQKIPKDSIRFQKVPKGSKRFQKYPKVKVNKQTQLKISDNPVRVKQFVI